MKKLIALSLVVLLAGCVSIPLGQAQQAENVNLGNGSIDQEKVSEVSSIIAGIAEIQGSPIQPTLTNVEEKSYIELTYSIGGNTLTVLVTPDYKDMMIGRFTSVQEIKASIEAEKARQAQAANITIAPVNVSGSNTKGSGKVHVVEFSDFECPFCGKFFRESYSNLSQGLIETNRITFHYMHFPLSFHPNAEPAALASECAAEQGLFWEMHDALFENQQSLSNISFIASKVKGLNQSEFNTCMEEERYLDKVRDESRRGSSYFITGTPAFIIWVNDELSDEQIRKLEDIASRDGNNPQRDSLFIRKDTGGKLYFFVVGAYPYETIEEVVSIFEGK